jgi:hypothetical protein
MGGVLVNALDSILALVGGLVLGIGALVLQSWAMG